MHDPTEGGLVTALWELAEAAEKTLIVDPARIVVPELADRVCRAFGIDPLTAIASGALLLTTPADQADLIAAALNDQGIDCSIIGRVTSGPPVVKRRSTEGEETWPRPAVDGITLAYQR
jgi:hydrogenase maturation factor